MNYYNDIDPACQFWLSELIKKGLLPEGDIDGRSITDVRANDLVGYDQCHFFAGIGGWPYALSLAQWTGFVWTGSCPCQPFSVAGKGKGTDDERHLWPEFCRLIAECHPPVVFGEQVASKAGRAWFHRVRADLERVGYGIGAADLCAASLNAPHIRQRLYWVADALPGGSHRRIVRRSAEGDAADRGASSSLLEGSGGTGWMGYTGSEGLEGRSATGGGDQAACWSPGMGFWDDYYCLPMLDGKTRRVESGSFPLADGIPNRVAKLCGLGNAIVPQVAQVFIEAYMSASQEP